MPSKTVLGPQPVRRLLDERGLTISEAALAIGVTFAKLQAPVTGRSRPSDEVRAKLPALLGVPLEDLFSAESLEPFNTMRKRPVCVCHCTCGVRQVAA